MPQRLLALFIFACILPVIAAKPKIKATQTNTDDMWVTSPAPELPTNVTHHTFHSASMNRDVGYCIYLPPNYDQNTDQRFPVIYHLHGAGGNETRSVYSASVLHEGIVSGKFDCGLLREPTARPEGVAFETLLREPLLAALPLDHHRLPPRRSANRLPRLSLGDLAGEGFILVRRPGAAGLYANLLALCRDLGFDPRIVAEVPRTTTCLNLVAAGAGVSVVPASMQDTQRHAVTYCSLVESARIDAPLTLAYRREDLHGPLAKFAAMAREVAGRPDPASPAAPGRRSVNPDRLRQKGP